MRVRERPLECDSPEGAIAAMIARLEGGAGRVSPEAVSLRDSIGRFLAREVVADRDSPAFDYAAMDGYAVCSGDVSMLASLVETGARVSIAVVDEARVGRAPPALAGAARGPRGTPLECGAIRIATGAPIPPGADAIIKREDVDEGADATRITVESRVLGAVRGGQHVRPRGENAKGGDRVLEGGALVSCAAVGALAAVGHTRPLVHPRVRVAVVTTGDEVVPPGRTPSPYEIRNSNGPVLAALLASQAWIEVVTPAGGGAAHAGDDGAEVRTALRDALGCADAVVMAGGVSMGHRDPVPDAVGDVGASVVFHGVPQRPGRPMLGAVLVAAGRVSKPIFGLPGNPVSAMVTCRRIVLPVLAALGGGARMSGEGESPMLPVSLGPRLVRLSNPDGQSLPLWWHRLVCLDGCGGARLLEVRGSGDIIAGARSDGFVEVPPAPGGASGRVTAMDGAARARPDGALVPFYAWHA